MSAACATQHSVLRILSVDDHPVYSQGLALALRAMKSSRLRDRYEEIQFEYAGTLKAAALRLSRQPAFDLVLLDMMLPDGNGLELLPMLARDDHPPVVMLSASDSSGEVERALAGGACGFLSKSAVLAEIDTALAQILEGRTVRPGSRTEIGESLSRRQAQESLTPRQLQVLQLLARGLPNKAIARELQCQEDTVKSHMKALFSKLGAHNRTECVRLADRQGLLDSV